MITLIVSCSSVLGKGGIDLGREEERERGERTSLVLRALIKERGGGLCRPGHSNTPQLYSCSLTRMGVLQSSKSREK